MPNQTISKQQADQHISKLKGFNLSRSWRGYGSAIFFEFGKLDEKQKGEYTLTSGEGWNLLFEDITISHKDDWGKLDEKLETLNTRKLVSVNLNEKSLEFKFDNFILEIDLDYLNNNQWSVSSSHFEGYLSTANGSFVIEKEG